MATTQVVGTIQGTETELITGTLTIRLDAPLVDESTTPDAVHYPKIQKHTVTNGNLNTAVPPINLIRNDEVTYYASFTYVVTDLILYLDGVEYAKVDYNGLKSGGPWHTYTDSKKYTGEVHSAQSKLLAEYSRQSDIPLFDPFHFHILTTYGATIEWSQLQHSNINTSNIDTSAYFISTLLKDLYGNILVAGLMNPRGDYNGGTTYKKYDVVSYPSDNSVYWYINETPLAGNIPTNTTYWMRLIQGTNITPSPIDPTSVLIADSFGSSWDGVTNKAPTANALYDQMIKYALLQDATFASLKAPTKNPSTNTTDVATTAFVQNAVGSITVPPATTAPGISDTGDNSTKIVNTNFLKRVLMRYCKAINQLNQGTAGGTISGGFALRNLNVLSVDDTEVTNGLTGGYIQLKPGFYHVEAYSCVSAVGQNRAILISSDGTFLILGTSENAAGNGYETRLRGNCWSRICGEISIGATTNIGIRHYAEITGINSEELGRAANRGGPEIFASIEVWRLD